MVIRRGVKVQRCAWPSDERLHLTDDGQVRLGFRQPWRDGTTDVVFDAVEFLGRLAVLVPRLPTVDYRLLTTD